MKNRIKTVLYTPKHSKSTDENIMRLLLPSFVGIILCMVCLAGSTWAWFSASVQTSPQTITAGNYDIKVDISPDPAPAEGGGYSLDPYQSYTVTLTASGTAPSGGYCKIEGGVAPLYTTQLKPGNALTFTLSPETTADYTFTAVWGNYSGVANITDGCTIKKQAGTPPAPSTPEAQQPADNNETVYVVQPGDSLWKIAQQYEGISADEIAAYNGIDKNAVLQVGQELKIPPADYEMPEEPISQETSESTSESEESTENAISE